MCGLAVLGLVEITDNVSDHDGLAAGDPAHLRFFVDHRPTGLVTVAKAITYLGSFPILIGIAAVGTTVLWRRGVRPGLALAPLVSLLIAGVTVSAMKSIIGRPRPPANLRLVTETAPSFPSGHSADATALYVAFGVVVAVVVLHRAVARAACIAAGVAAAVLVGLTRVVLGVHWPTDVLAGWVLGTAVAVLVVTLSAVITRDEVDLEPVKPPG